MRLKREIYRNFKRQVETGTEGKRTGFQKYYDKSVDSRKIAGTITAVDIRIGEVYTHAIYKMASKIYQLKK